jgi:hypothetical protein
VFDTLELGPFFQTDPESGLGDADFLECALMRDARPGWPAVSMPDFWRVSPDGKATLIRNYWEDIPDPHGRMAPGSYFSPNMLVRSLAEFIRHARGLSERFNTPTTVTFRIEWQGLQGRVLHDPWSAWIRPWTARANRHLAARSWPVAMLGNAWPEIVADLAAPAMRLFTTDFVASADWVRAQASRWLS